MNYVFDHNQEHNGYFDVFSSDESVDWLSIKDKFMDPLDKPAMKFDDIKPPSNEILNDEADDHDYYKTFDYKNISGGVLSPDNDIEPLSLFAEENSEVCSVIAKDHGIGKDTHLLFENPKTKETCHGLDKVIDSTMNPNVQN